MRVALEGGAYTARSVIANAQRCVNLYPESNPPGSAAPVTHYPTPGLTAIAFSPNAQPWRGLFVASNGDLYGVAGGSVYYINAAWVCHEVGTIANGSAPVRMADNSLTLVIVDGSAAGWQVDLGTRILSQITDPNFHGGVSVDYLDTFLLLNKPKTPQFYVSGALSTTFDPLYFANKSTYPDGLSAVAVLGQEIWLIGTKTTEIWFDSGATDFPFQRMPTVLIRHGCGAPYSVAKLGEAVLWLSQDMEGQAVVVAGSNYKAARISTHAIEAEISGYGTTSDAIGWTYEAQGHLFYCLTFPTADKTWCFDVTTGFWHERQWLDEQGIAHRHRANCVANAYGKIIAGDWQNGLLYALETSAYTDNGQPIERIRSFPHLGAEGKRVFYRQFIADMEVGIGTGTTAGQPEFLTGADGERLQGADGEQLYADAYYTQPQVSLRWSDDRGKSWGNPVLQSLGGGGEYLVSMQWQRLGMARDRVFELSWSEPYPAVLQGAFIDVRSSAS